MPKSFITYSKKFLKILFISLFLFLQINIIHANEIPEKLIGVGVESCPHVCEHNTINKGKNGFLVEVARRSFAYSGVKLDYKILSYKKFNDAVRAGSADVFVGTNKMDDNIDNLLFNNDAIASSGFSLYVLDGYNREQRYVDESYFKNKVLGVQNRNKFLITEIKKYIINNMLRNVNDFVFFDSENILKAEITSLKNNKIDVLLENDDIMDYYTSLEPSLKNQLVKVKSFDQRVGFYISFPNTEAGKKYRVLFEDGFKKLSSNGGLEISELRKKYGLNK